ncbi:hypothetical protein TD95_004628 [Thielaviopsis punctulata]|uniref:AHC1-like C2H2 zinc-finger domain-containing protein n=1 Tax=Thielaviopsis punctulata TaxID=72032 RepID=A0A0F4ZBS4_9PEZI|nr:hypothetical protein TD95_004628 [Thielaviopsis punctulata]
MSSGGLKRKHSAESYPSPLSPMSPGTIYETAASFPPEKKLKLWKTDEMDEVAQPGVDVDGESNKATALMDIIRAQFGYEILRKHNELRLINSELAKCQTAMEQLRRCHLIPYPVNVPTPSQMVDIARGKGPAVKWPGENVAKWAAPFGVVDGPYARHFAKWLIPDPVFDGGVPDFTTPVDSRGVRIPQPEYIGKRSTRSGSTQKNSISSFGPELSHFGATPVAPVAPPSHTPAKEKLALPSCVVKRSDGIMVRLQCLHCERKQFSSTQGFINHCRIAHKVDYKSHDEAGYKCGIPIEQADLGSILAPPPVAVQPIPSAAPVAFADGQQLVHQMNRPGMSESDVCSLLLSRISDTQKLMLASQNYQSTHRRSGSKSIPRKASVSSGKFVGCSETPALSKYLAAKNIGMNLSDLMSEVVDDSSDDDYSDSDNDDEDDVSMVDSCSTSASDTAKTAPSRPTIILKRGGSSASRCESEEVKTPIGNVEMDLDASSLNLSPKTVVSHGAPSLVDDSGSEEDDLASVASGPSPTIDVADMSADEESGRRRLYSDSFKRESSPLAAMDINVQHRVKPPSKDIRSSSKFRGMREN